MVLLAGSLFIVAAASRVRAAPVQIPAQQGAPSDTPTSTLTPTLTDTPADTVTATATPTLTLTPVFTDTATSTGTPTQIPTLTLTSAFTDTATSTGTPTQTPTLTITNTGTLPTSTSTPKAPHHIVISEFRTIGPLGANDEFVELYNPTGTLVDIGDWVIKKSSGCGTSISTLVNIYYGTILQPGQHYLVAAYASYSSITNADQRFSPGIADTSGLALISFAGAVVDEVGMCADTTYYEGTPLAPLPVAPLAGTPTPIPGTSNQSYERKPGGNTSCYDTGNNTNDFSLISPANPQSQANASVLCAGVALASPTPSPTITITPTRTPTHAPTAIPAVVDLNEFLPHPRTDWNGDGIANVRDEYIEIINVSPSALNVKGWKLDTGIGSIKTFTLPDMTLQPRQIAAFFGLQTGISLSDGGATVRLLRSDGRVADAYTYPAVEIADQTWCRLPDGTGVWGFTCSPSPGRPNTTVTVESSSGSICAQGSSAPDWLISSECGNFVSRISSSLEDGLFWLKSRWKWDVFLE
ncbi:MAG: lamin tail domain-containing protein [Anaerolineales bacterium]